MFALVQLRQAFADLLERDAGSGVGALHAQLAPTAQHFPIRRRRPVMLMSCPPCAIFMEFSAPCDPPPLRDLQVHAALVLVAAELQA